MSGTRLADRVFTADELAYARARGAPDDTSRRASPPRKRPSRRSACATSAFATSRSSGEPPTLRLHGRAADAARERGVELQVSLTHSQEMAAAVVVAGT